MGRISQPLEAVHLEAAERVDRAELVRDQDAPAQAGHAYELRHSELGTPHVVKGAVTCCDVERAVVERQRHSVALDEAHVRRRSSPSRLEVLRVDIHAHDLGHVGSERERERAGAAAGVEHGLVAGEGAEKATHTVGEVGSSLLLERQPQRDAHDAASARASDRARASASSRVVIVPAARSSSMSARIRPISGPGARPSSSPRTSGSGGSDRRAASTAPTSSGAPTNASASSAHGSVVRRKRWIDRGDGSAGGSARSSVVA